MLSKAKIVLLFAFFVFGAHKGFAATTPCGIQLPNGTNAPDAIYRGVPALSNENDLYGDCESHTLTDCKIGVEDRSDLCSYGHHYQCVEYIRRFYSRRNDTSNRLDTSNWHGDAGTYITIDSNHVARPHDGFSGVRAIANDGTSLPIPDDILVFSGGLGGHVAIVMSVSKTSLGLIEQNFGPHGTNLLAISGNTIADRHGSGGDVYHVVGWLRSTVNNPPGNPTGGKSVLSVDPDSLAFSAQPLLTASTAQPIVIGNTGTASMPGPTISFQGADAVDFRVSGNNCGGTVDVGRSCEIQVVFTPSGTGTRNATLIVSSNGADASPKSIGVSGQGSTKGVQIKVTSMTPANPIVGVSQVYIYGTASPFVQVAIRETRPNGDTLPFSAASDAKGNFVDGPFTPQQLGKYTENFSNQYGDLSATFTFTAIAATKPVISGIKPTSPTHKAGDQPVTIMGEGFEAGLTAVVTYPGGQGTLSGSQVPVVGPKEIDAQITLGSSGPWSIQVTNPEGSMSDPFPFNVQ